MAKGRKKLKRPTYGAYSNPGSLHASEARRRQTQTVKAACRKFLREAGIEAADESTGLRITLGDGRRITWSVVDVAATPADISRALDALVFEHFSGRLRRRAV